MPCLLWTARVLDGFFAYQAQMISIMRGYVAHNDLWPWPISSRSFGHDFGIKLLKYVCPTCCVHSVMSAVVDGFFPFHAQMNTTMRGCVALNDLWPWPIPSRSSSLDFAVKLLRYGTSCSVQSSAWNVLDGFFPYLARLITGVRGCVACSDLWPWPISSRFFSCDIAYCMDYIHVAQIQPMTYNVSCTISRPTGRKWRSHRPFACLQSGLGYSSRSLNYTF